MEVDIFQVDAFSSESFGGNPAGVVPDAKDLSQEHMQLIAREMNLSETAFVTRIDDDNFDVRFFTPEEEVDLCGHATIGTFFAFAEKGYIKPLDNGVKTIYQNTKVGKLPVYISYVGGIPQKVSMEQAKPKKFGPVLDVDELARSLGIDKECIGLNKTKLRPEIVSTGLKDIILPVKTKEILDNIRVDKDLLTLISEKNDVVGVHAFYMEDRKGSLVYTRNFAPRVGIDEESATGTSNGALIYLLKDLEVLRGNHLRAYQGELMDRPSIIECEITDDNVVMVGGQAKVLLEGKIVIGDLEDDLYIEKSLEDYISHVSSDRSMPGGGSVAALVGSLSASLTNMSFHLTKDKQEFKELDPSIKKDMFEKSQDLDRIISKLNEIVDEDTKAFNSVLDAFKLPKYDEDQKAIRKKAIEDGYKSALSLPLKAMELSLEVLRKQRIFAVYGNKNLITDIGIGSILAYSTIESSRLNVLVNLKGVGDGSYVEEIKGRMDLIVRQGNDLKVDILNLVDGII